MTEAVPVEKKLDSTRIEVGACRFCGQTYQMEVDGPWTEAMLDKAATEKCTCDDALKAKKRERVLEKCGKKVDQMFEEQKEQFRETLKNICTHIYDEDMDKASLTIDGRTKVTIGWSKGNIKIERTEKTTKVSEIE